MYNDTQTLEHITSGEFEFSPRSCKLFKHLGRDVRSDKTHFSGKPVKISGDNFSKNHARQTTYLATHEIPKMSGRSCRDSPHIFIWDTIFHQFCNNAENFGGGFPYYRDHYITNPNFMHYFFPGNPGQN